jgi:hypothetical protein
MSLGIAELTGIITADDLKDHNELPQQDNQGRLGDDIKDHIEPPQQENQRRHNQVFRDRWGRRITNPTVSQPTFYQDSQNVHTKSLNKNVLIISNELVNKFCNNVPKYIPNSFTTLRRCIKYLERYIGTSLATTSIPEINVENYFSSPVVFTEYNSNQQFLLSEVFIATVYELLHCVGDDKWNRFSQEMNDSIYVCSTGKLTRLVNSIQGFTKDPKLHLSIDPLDIYGQVIKNRINKLLGKNSQAMDGIVEKTPEYLQWREELFQSNLDKWSEEFEVNVQELREFILKSY